MASTSAKPAMAALRITPVAPTRSPTMRAATTTNPRNIAKAITDQKANGAECRRRRRFRASRLSPERQKDGHTRHQSRNEERRSDQPQERRLQRCDDDDHA